MSPREEIDLVRALAARQLLAVEPAIMRGHVRLACRNGAYIKRVDGSAAFPPREDRHYLERLPDARWLA